MTEWERVIERLEQAKAAIDDLERQWLGSRLNCVGVIPRSCISSY
jgi:hypothetical protein